MAHLIYHGVIWDAASSRFLCADEVNPRHVNRCLQGVRLRSYNPQKAELLAYHDGKEAPIDLCDGCLERLVGHFLDFVAGATRTARLEGSRACPYNEGLEIT